MALNQSTNVWINSPSVLRWNHDFFANDPSAMNEWLLKWMLHAGGASCQMNTFKCLTEKISFSWPFSWVKMFVRSWFCEKFNVLHGLFCLLWCKEWDRASTFPLFELFFSVESGNLAASMWFMACFVCFHICIVFGFSLFKISRDLEFWLTWILTLHKHKKQGQLRDMSCLELITEVVSVSKKLDFVS